MAFGPERERVTRTEYETVSEQPAVVAEERTTVATDPYEDRREGVRKLVQAVSLLFGVIISLIAIRFVLLLLGANPDAGFTSFIYSLTGPFVAPFEGMFGVAETGNSVLDPASLVAIIIYSLLAWLVTKVIWLARGDSRRAVRMSSRRVDSEIR